MANTDTPEKTAEQTAPQAQARGTERRTPAREQKDAQQSDRGGRGGGRRGGGGRERRPRRTRERARPEYEQKIIGIRRVTRVTGGGRRFTFSVAVVIGNQKGQVGVGQGKASDTALAIEKAVRDARKRLVSVSMTDQGSIKHEVQAKFAASEVLLVPAPGKGLRAGSSVRTVLEFAGVRDVSGKIISRSKNRYNNALATITALEKLPA